MALEGLYIRVTHTGTVSGPLLIDDVDSGFETNGSASRVRRPGPVYVPVSGHIDLVYSSTVAHSYESGSIKQWVDDGKLTVSLLRGATVVKDWLYSFATDGGGLTTHVLADVNGNALQIPAKCIGVRGWVEVVDAILAAGGAANVSVGVTGTNAALLAATAKASFALNAVLPFSGTVIHNGTDNAAPVAHRFTSATNVTVTPDTNALTAGKFYVHIELLSSLE